MSVRATCTTQITDLKILHEVLCELYDKKYVKIENENIVLTNTNYITTFSKNAKGVYDLLYDSSDRTKLKNILPKKVNNTTISVLDQTYAKKKIHQLVKKIKGKVFSETVENEGIIRIKVKA